VSIIQINNWQLELILDTYIYGDKEILLYRINNLDELIDQVSDDEFNIDERLPYWGELWPSAIALSRFIFDNANLIVDKSILELGCGLGLTSIAAIIQRPKQLICTDYEEPALELTKKNIKLNKLEVPVLRLLDWRNPDLDNKFEIILASDILYEKRFFQPLIDLIGKYLVTDGTLILAEPNRSIARDFFDMLRNHKYDYKIHFKEVGQNDKNILVSVYLIRKR